MQTYKNIELAKLSEEDSNADIIEYIKATSSKYICFWEVSCEYDNDKISEMVWKLGIQSFLGSLLFRVFRSGSSVGSFSRVWF